MRTNLFDLIEGLFEGTLHFFYNFLSSVWTVLVHPLAGPQQLLDARAAARTARAAKSARGAAEGDGPQARPQLGGVTFLFVCYFVLFLASDLAPGGLLRLDSLYAMVSAPGSIGIGPAWPSVVGAIVVAALIDMALRALVLARGILGERPIDADERDETVNRAEYALLWPCLATIAVVLLASGLRLIFGPGEPPDSEVAIILVGLLAIYGAYLFPVLQLWPTLRQREGKLYAWLFKLFVAASLLVAAVSWAFIAGLDIAGIVHAAGASVPEAPAPARP